MVKSIEANKYTHPTTVRLLYEKSYWYLVQYWLIFQLQLSVFVRQFFFFFFGVISSTYSHNTPAFFNFIIHFYAVPGSIYLNVFFILQSGFRSKRWMGFVHRQFNYKNTVRFCFRFNAHFCYQYHHYRWDHFFYSDGYCLLLMFILLFNSRLFNINIAQYFNGIIFLFEVRTSSTSWPGSPLQYFSWNLCRSGKLVWSMKFIRGHSSSLMFCMGVPVMRMRCWYEWTVIPLYTTFDRIR